jgi:D-sedoheptulose 7-phosphate isomerase
MNTKHKNHTKYFFNIVKKIANKINYSEIEMLAKDLNKVKKNKGRIFFLGVGGSAANSSHAVNDFRKLCEIESYSALDNIAELTARINDEGWNSSLSNWLRVSRLNFKDAVFILSVGGGNIKKNVSVNLIQAIKYAKIKKSKVFGIVGRDGGFAKKYGHRIIIIPPIDKNLVTPQTEAFQAVVWCY